MQIRKNIKCPRCNGRLFTDNDFYTGWYEKCVQCGHLKYLEEVIDEELAREAV